ncbi:MAG: mechanosensitive ion channel family protein, partial [Bacteroidota bacterium]
MEKFITEAFWQDLYQKSLEWTLTQLPSIIIFLIVIIILQKIFTSGLNRIGKMILKRSEAQKDREAEKRVNTLMGILKGVIKIVLWTIFFMTFLKKIGTDIGPLIASAGII